MDINITKEPDSKLIYKIKCEYCGCEFEYQKEDLGYRMWFPHGFVYCPRCKNHLDTMKPIPKVKNEKDSY